MTATHTDTDAGLGTVVHLPPDDVVLDVNARTEAVFDPDRSDEDARFLANVREHGVLTPVIARHDAVTGKPLVVAGQRRTLAARAAGLPTIPVYVVPDMDAAERLARQVTENTARRGHTDADLARAYAQLAAFGLDEETIATRTGDTTTRVRAALTVHRSQVASAALNGQALTIEQALAVAEFEDDPAAVDRIKRVVEDNPDRLEHTVQQLRDDRVYAQELADLQAQAAALNVPELEWKPSWDRRSWTPLGDLQDPTDGATGPMTVEAHGDCPGRAIVIDPHVYDPEVSRSRPRLVHVCDRPHLYGHQAHIPKHGRPAQLKAPSGSRGTRRPRRSGSRGRRRSGTGQLSSTASVRFSRRTPAAPPSRAWASRTRPDSCWLRVVRRRGTPRCACGARAARWTTGWTGGTDDVQSC